MMTTTLDAQHRDDLRAAAKRLRAAEARALKLAGELASARVEVRAAQAHRKQLVEQIASDEHPERIRDVAEALNVSPARVYQLLRSYPSQSGRRL